MEYGDKDGVRQNFVRMGMKLWGQTGYGEKSTRMRWDREICVGWMWLGIVIMCYSLLSGLQKIFFQKSGGVLLRRWGDLLGLFQSLNAVQLMYCACTVVMHPVGHKRELQLNEKSAQRRRKHWALYVVRRSQKILAVLHPGRASVAVQIFLAPPYYIQRSVLASPLSTFFI